MNEFAEQFGRNMGQYLAHVLARSVPVAPTAPAASKKPSAPATKHANSKKAVQTRQARYGDTKLHRGTRDDMQRKKQFDVREQRKR